jgi:hypothetical protein
MENRGSQLTRKVNDMKRKYRVYSEYYIEIDKTDDPDMNYEEAYEVAADDVITNLLENWDLEEVK